MLEKVKAEKAERGTNLKILLQIETTIAFERVQSLMMGLESMNLKYVAKVGPKTPASAQHLLNKEHTCPGDYDMKVHPNPSVSLFPPNRSWKG